MSNYNIVDAKFINFFKTVYGKRGDATYNMSYPLLSRIKKSDNFIGKDFVGSVQLGRSGSVSAGYLPDVNVANVGKLILSRKKTYASYVVDRETLVAGVADQGSFEDTQKFIIKSTIDSYTRNVMRIICGNGTLGTVGSLSSVGATHTLVISTATWKEANWEEGDFVNVASSTDRFLVDSVVPSTRTVVITNQTGTYVPLVSDIVYMQKSKDKEPTGLETVLGATSGVLYGIDVQRRWQSYAKAAGGAAISEALLSEAILEMQKATGEAPTAIYMSYVQMNKYLSILAKPQYELVRNKSGEYTAQYSALSILTPVSAKPIPIFAERFVKDAEIFLLNEPRIEMRRAPKHGWFTEDGLFSRVQGLDEYEARYGGYWELYAQPSYQGRITGLAV